MVLDLEERALWHLELLGCFSPGDACVPGPFADEADQPDDWDDDDDLGCTRCGGEGWGEVEDPLWDECDQYGYGPCCACRGTGERRRQWVF